MKTVPTPTVHGLYAYSHPTVRFGSIDPSRGGIGRGHGSIVQKCRMPRTLIAERGPEGPERGERDDDIRQRDERRGPRHVAGSGRQEGRQEGRLRHGHGHGSEPDEDDRDQDRGPGAEQQGQHDS